MLPEPHEVLWRNLATPGAEYCKLVRSSGSWELTGAVVQAVDGRPIHASYTVVCNRNWHTRSFMLLVHQGRASRCIVYTVDDRQRWYVAGDLQRKLGGCIDVDLGMSPAAKTLPIRRLQLDVGAAAEIKTAWVRFPELEVVPLKQRYTRLSARRYRHSRGDDTVEIEVDDFGLVTSCVGAWERLAHQAGTE